jgi:hypothetical protein
MGFELRSQFRFSCSVGRERWFEKRRKRTRRTRRRRRKEKL